MATTSDNLKLSDLYVFDADTATIRVPDTTVVEESVIEDTKAALGADVDTTTSTPIGRMIEWWTLNFKNVINVNMQNSNQLMVSAAAGQQLDCIADWFGLSRKGNAKLTVPCYLTGTANTTIPEGAMARDANDHVYQLTESVELDSDGEAEDAPFQCLEYGPITCPKGSLVIIETPINGWNTITNLEDASGGRLIESDEDLRSRIMNFKDDGVGFLNSIKTAVDKVDGVNSSVVLENNTGDELEVHGVPLEPHSIFVCVDPVSGDTQKQAIAKAIFNTKPCGTGYTELIGLNGTTNAYHVSVDDGYGNSYTVIFNSPEQCKIKTKLSVRNRSYTGRDITGDVKTAVLNWASSTTFGIGESVYGADIINAVEAAVPGVIVVDIIVNEGGSDATFIQQSYQDVPASAKATFTWTSGETTVNQITVEEV